MKHTAKELHEQLDASVKRNTELRNEIMQLKRDCGNDTKREVIGGIIIPRHPEPTAIKRLTLAIENMRSFCPPAVQKMADLAIDAAMLETGEQTKEKE